MIRLSREEAEKYNITPKRGRPKGSKVVYVGDKAFDKRCAAAGLPIPDHEYPFAADVWLGGDPDCKHGLKKRFRCLGCGARLRQWRWDYLFEGWLAVEKCGGVWQQGHHSRGQDQIDDWEKWNEGHIMGYALLVFTPEQLEDGSAFAVIWRALLAGIAEQP